MLGIDVSENNGYIDWESVKNAGYEFAIIRLGWGHSHLDESFYDNINGAIDAGLKVGVYYYSYALSDDAAREEAEFCANLLEDCGLTNDMLEMGVWFDMEDADGYKDRNGFTDRQELTDCVNVFVNHMAEKGYRCGLYSNYDWLTNVLYMEQVDCDVWCAQYNYQCDYPNAAIWQYSDCEKIGGQSFDADETIDFE